MDFGDTFLAILIGLGLSVACGFRVFTPALVMGIAAYTGNIELAEGSTWLVEGPMLIALAIAAVCEFIIHQIPAIDDMLNVVEAPLAFVAGTILSSSMVTDMDPFLKWSLAAIAGGGSAEALHVSRTVLKGGLNISTFGLSTPLVSSAESLAAIAVPILAILLPVSVLFLYLALLCITAYAIRKWIVRRRRMSA